MGSISPLETPEGKGNINNNQKMFDKFMVHKAFYNFKQLLQCKGREIF